MTEQNFGVKALNPLARQIGSEVTAAQNRNDHGGGSFMDVLRNIGHEAKELSEKADYMSTLEGIENSTELGRATALSQAQVSVEELTRTIEVTKAAYDNVYNTQL